MCGINGIYAYHYAANPIDRNELLRTRDHMARRGPDGSGAWHSDDGRVGLGHRRLSIIDLSDRATQPMASADGKTIVTFNGEIYNYRALRNGLEAKGHVFRTESDTEVLIHLYAEKGEAMVHDLRGMFAFAVWDRQRERFFAARDRFGIKPFYYSDDGWSFRFASQVKALLAGGACSRERDPAGHAGFYLFGAVPEPFTTYAAIRTLPAGCYLIVDRFGLRAVRRYYELAERYRAMETRVTNPEEAAETVRAALSDSVRHHLVADVPVGAFLSAGVDSGALVGLMRDVSQGEINTVTIGFTEFVGTANDENPLAEGVARRYETRHTKRLVTKQEFLNDIPAILEAMDQPSIDGFNSWFVSKAARELGLKVAISGLGGDELLGGYPSFDQIPRLESSIRWPARVPILPVAVRRLIAAANPARFGLNPKIAGLMEYGGSIEGAYLLRRGLFMPWELPHVMGREFAIEGLRRLAPLSHLRAVLGNRPNSHFAQVATLETAVYMRNQLLRDVDWASMAHSLEVRVPLVDHPLLETSGPHILAIAAAGQRGKELLAAAPARPLPEEIIHRPKTGFSTPVSEWVREALHPRLNKLGDQQPARTSATRELAGLVLAG